MMESTFLKAIPIDNSRGKIPTGIRIAVGGSNGTVVLVEVVDGGNLPAILSFDPTATQDPNGNVYLLPVRSADVFVLAPQQTLYVNTAPGSPKLFLCYNAYDLGSWEALAHEFL